MCIRDRAATVAAFLLILAGVSFLLLWETTETSQIEIDGISSDWDSVKKTEQEAGNVDNANLDVILTAALSDSVYLSILSVTEEPMFSSSEGYTLRILIDSDDNAETGYSLPSVGADQMLEIYGKNSAILSSVLYTFNDNRDNSDWNGFAALSTINARALGDTVEMQVPLFDLGASNQDEMKIVWQSSDGNGNTDLADNIVSLSGEKSTISGAIGSLVNDANSVNEGEGVVIDGYFGDWNDVEKLFDVISNTETEHVDLEQYAAVTQNENTFMYLNVKGNILNGISIPAYGCLLYTSPSPRDATLSRMPSSA